MSYASYRSTRLDKLARRPRDRSVPDSVTEIWRIHYDLDFWQPVEGYDGVWELKPESITRLNDLLKALSAR